MTGFRRFIGWLFEAKTWATDFWVGHRMGIGISSGRKAVSLGFAQGLGIYTEPINFFG